MSRIGKLPISIPSGVTVEVNNNVVTVKGPKDTLTQEYSKNITVEVKDNQVIVTRNDETTDSNAKQGLYRQLINNMVVGVKDGFSKSLTVNGVGYKLNKQGKKLVMNLGLSHPVEVEEIAGITLEVPDNNTILVKGANKELVGAVAAKIRALRPMEPYHGYGIHYTSEPVILKPGKSAGKKK
ncbi:MAG: 50S ribosomal protein L6 [Clostridiales bacterium]|nr:50S ribosomal protein L6 [Clostridiales bacterium]